MDGWMDPSLGLLEQLQVSAPTSLTCAERLFSSSHFNTVELVNGPSWSASLYLLDVEDFKRLSKKNKSKGKEYLYQPRHNCCCDAGPAGGTDALWFWEAAGGGE